MALVLDAVTAVLARLDELIKRAHRAEFLAGLQILATGASFVGSTNLVVLEDPAGVGAAGVQLYHNGRAEWSAVSVRAIGYLNAPIRIGRNRDDCRQTATCIAIVPDNTVQVFILSPNESLFAIGTEAGGVSYASVSATPVTRFEAAHV